MELQFPEILLLAVPVWYAMYRRRAMPGESGWLLAIPLWLIFICLNFSIDESSSAFSETMIPWLQRYSAWLLPVACWFGLRKWSRTAGVTHWLRLAIVGLLIFSLSGPKFNVGGKGLDVIIVVDRSRSLPPKATENMVELQETLRDHRRAGDRLGIVAFGRTARIEQLLSEHRLETKSQHVISRDGSDLNDAILKALSLVNPDRPARILVLSDGEANGPSPKAAARRALADGVPIDFRLFERVRARDVAVKSLDIPENISPNERFLFSALIHADGDCVGEVLLFREGFENGQRVRRQVAKKTVSFRSGNNRVRFAHSLKQIGSYRYDVEVKVKGDPLKENNTGTGVVRVVGAPRLLLLVKDEAAKQGRLAKLLTSSDSGLATDVRVAEKQPLTKDQLDLYRAVIIENVPAQQLGHLKMARLAQFVIDRGLGLMLTGGENSFGTGGYFKSPLDKVMPVSMEMREEDRKSQVAIAVVMDRSGSMSAMVGGRSKMELANLGAAECVNLLSPRDQLAVISVDTQPHVNQPLTLVDDKKAITSRVHRITVGGGGIYVDIALKAAKKELDKARGVQTRHIILFSDARDTEISGGLNAPNQPEREARFLEYVRSLRRDGMTISVIGLGTKEDVHAELLTKIAKIGGGNIMFASDARDLPRLFAQDTINVARNTFIRKTDRQPNGIPGTRTRGPHLVGQLGTGPFPNVYGYNLSYLRKNAQVAVTSKDEYKAPWSAFWNHGLGRVAAITVDVGGEFAGPFARWEHSGGFLLTHVRWLLGGDDPRQMFVALARDGQEAVVTVELDDPRPGDVSPYPQFLRVIPPGLEVEQARKVEFVWIDHNLLQARFLLDGKGIFFTTVVTGESSSFPGPSIALPYSSEFFPRDGLPTGRETLQEIARISGGQELTNVLAVLEPANRPRSPRMVSLLPWLLGIVIGLLVIEIAGRRLSLWIAIQQRWQSRKQTVTEPNVSKEPGPRPGWLPKWKLTWKRKRTHQSSAPTAKAPQPGSPQSAEPEKKPVVAPSMNRLLEEAKQRAERRRNK